MKKIKILIMVLAILLSGIVFDTNDVSANERTKDVVIVIDAGHGGEDPGALAVTGAYESQCNLAITKAMKAELDTYEGVKVYLTRSEDEWSAEQWLRLR